MDDWKVPKWIDDLEETEAEIKHAIEEAIGKDVLNYSQMKKLIRLVIDYMDEVF